MLTAREAATSLYGAYRLARFDAGGMTFFNITLEGFWRSFYAAVIIAPLFAVLLFMRFAAGEVAVHPMRFAFVEVIAYVISWVAFPLIMVTMAKMLDREKHYLGYITAYNWASVLQNGVYLPLAIMMMAGILPEQAANFFGLVVFALILAYAWFVTRVALDVSAIVAAGVVILDLLLSVFISASAEEMF
ncbi:MAG: hypothetical protein QF511_12760 [Rhodospirillales bacterium]|jgi:hypothetical protein|nr:hypothetical protein [Rhodospirillales bacterium]HIJ43401.1 hypothetical protein [Rhodospirillaceae bacterium]MDP7214861.1 hypothetical protein [Rhodospirillales bacterium]HIJ45221.1 hypothetical protein [Rhodospirillaceae bacterium]HIJ93284.1 hypothetical protein [Rhodospirillaceae bacterium]